MKRMATKNFTCALVLTVLSFAAACSSTYDGENGTQSIDTQAIGLLPGDRPVEHPIHSGELLLAMVDLENLALEELSENLESDNARATQLERVERIADTLTASVAALPSLVRSSDLPSDNRARFEELAGQLGRDVRSLRERAASGDLGSAREEREVLLETCNACHAEFRAVRPSAGQ